MRVLYTPSAQRDRLRQIAYIEQYSIEAADRIDRRIEHHARLIGLFPNIGKHGREAGSREFQVAGTELLLVYRVLSDRVQIIRVLHGAQDWPGRF